MYLLVFLSLLILTPSEQQPIEDILFREAINSMLRSSQDVLNYKTVDFYKFKGIPEFAELGEDETRNLYRYEQTIAVRDLGDDNVARRCEIMEVYGVDESNEVLQTLSNLLRLKVENLDMESMMKVMNDCDSIDNSDVEDVVEPWWGGDESDEEDFNSASPKPNPIFNGIIPGTNWCGFGDIAKSYHDLGGLRNVDRCCRSHDLCPVKVLAKDDRYNLTNKAVYTKSHCICDEAFYNCLKADNGWSAKFIGNLYFYAASPQCIKGLPEYTTDEMKFIPATKKW